MQSPQAGREGERSSRGVPSEQNLRRRVRRDLTEAVKRADELTVRTLRLLEAAVTNEEIARKRAALTDADILRILEREVKRRREAAEMYQRGGREERAAAELQEASVLTAYLPAQLSDDELERIVRAALAEAGLPSQAAEKELGKVMGAVMAKVRGKADGARVRAVLSRIVQAL